MKAMVLKEFEKPLRLEQVPIPRPGPRDALVRVKACAVGRLDNWVKMGVMDAWQVAPPVIPGHQVAGVVAEVGKEAAGVRVGDHVVVHVLITCEKCDYCLTLREAQCRMHTHIGAQCDGGFAEYIKMPAANLIKIPQEVPFEAATMIPVNIGCSWHLLAKRAGLKPLEDVLVVGAGGAWAFTSFNWPSLWGLAGRSGSMCLRR